MIVTSSNTVFINGIEHNDYPAPPTLTKAANYYWASKLLHDGLIRLSSLELYQKIELDEIGDANEGRGEYRLDGNKMETGSSSEVFIWCGSLPGTSHKTLIELNEEYDSIIEIVNVCEFIKRISNELIYLGYKLMPQVGSITYDKGNEVTKHELNNQKWQYNVFQKDYFFSHQREFRIAFSNVSLTRVDREYIDLCVGDLSDIVHVQKI